MDTKQVDKDHENRRRKHVDSDAGYGQLDASSIRKEPSCLDIVASLGYIQSLILC
jgi:hypothetical protein